MYTNILIALLLTNSVVLNNNTANDDWKKEIEGMLYEFMSCGGPTAPNTPCNEFLAKALKKVYNIEDFIKPSGRYMLANEVADFVKNNENLWTLLGKGDDQNVLNEAQGYANVKKAIIAVYKNTGGHGHVAIILPGATTYSNSWKLNCPNSASFFLNEPLKAYVAKHLGYSFPSQNKSEVLIYGRNY